MSSLPVMKNIEGSTEELRLAVQHHIDRMKQAIVEAQRFLEYLERGPDARDLEVLKLLYGNGGVDLGGLDTLEAIMKFLAHVGQPQPRWVIFRALALSRIDLGDQPQKTVNQSISTNVNGRKLAEPHPLRDGRGPSEMSMVGLPGMKFGR